MTILHNNSITTTRSLASRLRLTPVRLALVAVIALHAAFPLLACQEMAAVADTAGFHSTANVLRSVDRVAKGFSEENEYFYGRGVSANIDAIYETPDYAALRETPGDAKADALLYLNRLGGMIAQVSDIPHFLDGWHFGTLDTDSVSAFSAPGGFCYFSTGLIQMCDTEDQLAAVVAHEIAHVTLRHGLTALEQQAWGDLFSSGLGAMGEWSDEDWARETGRFGDAMGAGLDMMMGGYSRDQELDADARGLVYMVRIGYDPAGMAEVLQKLIDHEAAVGTGTEGDFAATHPPASERLEAVQGLIDTDGLSGSTSITRTRRFMRYRDDF